MGERDRRGEGKGGLSDKRLGGEKVVEKKVGAFFEGLE